MIKTFYEVARRQCISCRSFLKSCSVTTTTGARMFRKLRMESALFDTSIK
jgi:hypothetical protein